MLEGIENPLSAEASLASGRVEVCPLPPFLQSSSPILQSSNPGGGLLAARAGGLLARCWRVVGGSEPTRAPQTASRRFKTAPRRLQDGSRTLQDGSKTLQDAPRRAQDGPRHPRDAPTISLWAPEAIEVGVLGLSYGRRWEVGRWR